MAFPMVVTTSSRAVMDIADFIMITRLDAEEAQAAILPAQIAMWCYLIFGVGIVSMVNTFASQSLGRKQFRQCSAYAWQSFYIAALFGVVGLAIKPLLPLLIASFSHSEAVQAMELAYTRVAMYTVAPTIASYGLGWFFVGVHRPWVTMWSALEANVVNIAVSFVLIFGHLGFEPMGIAGAAWGTVAAVCYRMIRLTATMLGPRAASAFATRETWRPSWTCLKGLMRIGLPCALQWVCEVVVWAIFITVLVGKKFGMVHLIATNTAWQYMRLAFMPTLGVGQALTALVGKSIGEGNPERAIRETRVATLLTIAYMAALSLVYWFFGAALIRLFNADPEVVEIGATVMKCAAVFQLFDAISIAYNSALRGAGDTFIPSLFFIVSNWVIIVGCGWVVATYYPQFGSIGPWMTASVLIVITGVFLWWRWHSKEWMKLRLFDTAQGETDHVSKTDQDATALTTQG